VLSYTYTSLGYAQQVIGPSGQVYWTANARDAELRLIQQTAGNGVTSQSSDAATGRLTAILAGAGNIVTTLRGVCCSVDLRRTVRSGTKLAAKNGDLWKTSLWLYV
jgi:hypothetical protein